MPYKNILSISGNRKSALITVLLLSCIITVQAQSTTGIKLPAKDSLPSGVPLPSLTDKTLYNNLVDSLNHRKLFPNGFATSQTRLDTLFKSKLKETAFGGMKDSVMGEFLYYVKNNFGKDRVNKIVKNFSVSRDSGSLQNFIGSKIRGFYSVNGMESFKIPSFNKFLNNHFSGVEYNVVHDNTQITPAPWMHQLQVSDQVMLMDIPFQVGFSNLSNDYTPLQYNNLMKVSFD